MPGVEVEVRPALIKWARKRSGRSTNDLLKVAKHLEEWEAGTRQPTFAQLSKFAKATFTPLGFLFLPEPPEDKLPIRDFRTRKDRSVQNPSPHLLETVHLMIQRQEWMRDFLEADGYDPLPFVGSAKLSRPVKAVATAIRETLKMGRFWASNCPSYEEALRLLRQKIEGARILVVINGVVGNDTHRKLNPKEFQGFALADSHAPLVFVNGADFKNAQMFTLAHELAHIWFGLTGVSVLNESQAVGADVETVCNAVAAEVLVTEDEFREVWPAAKGSGDAFGIVSRRFKVSRIVAARRALDLDLMPRKEFFAFWKEEVEALEEREAKKTPGGDFYSNQNTRVGNLFGRTVALAAIEGRLLYSDAYRLTGMRGATFDSYVESLGLGSAQ